ncbi:hypothetical protein R6Z07F_018106 [Ovis aries]
MQTVLTGTWALGQEQQVDCSLEAKSRTSPTVRKQFNQVSPRKRDSLTASRNSKQSRGSWGHRLALHRLLERQGFVPDCGRSAPRAAQGPAALPFVTRWTPPAGPAPGPRGFQSQRGVQRAPQGRHVLGPTGRAQQLHALQPRTGTPGPGAHQPLAPKAARGPPPGPDQALPRTEYQLPGRKKKSEVGRYTLPFTFTVNTIFNNSRFRYAWRRASGLQHSNPKKRGASVAWERDGRNHTFG